MVSFSFNFTSILSSPIFWGFLAITLLPIVMGFIFMIIKITYKFYNFFFKDITEEWSTVIDILVPIIISIIIISILLLCTLSFR